MNALDNKKNILSIAHITIKGSRIEKIYYLLFFTVVIVLLLTPYFASMSPRQGKQVALDFILSTQSFTGLIIATFVGSGLIARDVDKKVIYSVITKSVSRSQYVIGRFLGIALILLLAIILMSFFGILSYYATLWMFITLGDAPNWYVYWLNAIFLYLKLLIIVAVAFLFSSFSTSTIFPLAVTIGVYIAGASAIKVKSYLETLSGANWGIGFKLLVNSAFYLFPNLSAFDLKAQAAYGLSVNSLNLIFVALYGLLYISVMLFVTVVIFNRRDLI